MTFAGNPRNEIPEDLPFKLTDYLELVELKGRVIQEEHCLFLSNYDCLDYSSFVKNIEKLQ